MVDESRALVVVGIGSSAGGLSALKALLPNLPVDQDACYILVQHMDPNHPSTLDRILAKHSTLAIELAKDETRLTANHLYIAPADHDCVVVDGTLKLVPIDLVGPRHSVDVLLGSLARAVGRTAIGMVLSGTGSDGCRGAHDIKAADGLVLVQEPADAEYGDMPRAVLKAKLADVVAPATALGAELKRLITWMSQSEPAPYSKPQPDIFNTLLQLLHRKTGFAFDQYKEATLHRRIKRRMVINQLEDIKDYLALVENSDSEAGVMLKEIQISVTAFFRDRDIFELLKNVIESIVAAKSNGDTLRIWVPGCASGEEAFSIAMLAAEAVARRTSAIKVLIFATDVDTDAIALGRKSVYLKSETLAVPADLRGKYLEKMDGTVKIRADIRDMVVFSEHDLIQDPPFSRLDLVSCRNVLIYLRQSTQDRLLPLFHYSLNPGGYLLLGPSESVDNNSPLFAAQDTRAKLFRRKDVVARPPAITGQWHRRQPQDDSAPDVAIASSADSRAQHAVVERYTPPHVLVNKSLDVVYLHGALNQFLSLPQGDTTVNLIELAATPLRLELRLILQKAQRQRTLIKSAPVTLPAPTGNLSVTLVAVPVDENNDDQSEVVVLFESTLQTAREESQDSQKEVSQAAELRIRELEQELTVTREHLQSNIEDLEISNEELQSRTEELHSANEDMQTTNEEMQSTNEEMQSTNEELHVVNDELIAKSNELASANADLETILNTVTSAVIVLDADTRVTRYSVGAKAILDVLPTSIGRPVASIGGAIDLTVLSSEIRTAMDSLQQVERELELDNRIFLVRLQPTPKPSLGGLIISFHEETERLSAERTARRLATVVRDANDAITVLEPDGRILEWNRGAELLYGYTESEAQGMQVSALVPKSEREALRRMMQQLMAGDLIQPADTTRVTKDGRRIPVRLTATGLRDESGKVYAIGMTEYDLSDRVLAEHARTTLRDAKTETAKRSYATLTAREREIMGHLVGGYANASSRQIADELGISPRTVDTHRRRIREKMKAHSTANLVHLAQLCGLVDTDPP